MRILIDTNILIPLEDTTYLSDRRVAEMARLAAKHRCVLLIHPASLADLERDRDNRRRSIVRSKLAKYNILEQPPEPDWDFLLKVHHDPNNANDVVDNKLLCALSRDTVHVLVTEDRGIHKKAARLGLASRTYYVDQCVAALHALYEPKERVTPNVKAVPIYTISVNQPFFDSLRADYDGFDRWFAEKAREGRKAWVNEENGELGAICIYKQEDSPTTYLAGLGLKLCTFKVSDSCRGRKLGELLLKNAFQFCIDNGLKYTYLIVLPDKQHLVSFLHDFGFVEAEDLGRESVYVKRFDKPSMTELSPVEYNIRYYPHFMADPPVQKFVVPIRPEYHNLIFPEYQRQLTFFPSGRPVSNALRKAYVSTTKSNLLQQGDLVLFYRSTDLRAVTTLGIVEDVIRSSTAADIAAVVGKRTVYSFEDLEEMCKSSMLAFLFRQLCHLNHPVSYRRLLTLNAVKNHVETLTRISHDSFTQILQEAGL